MDQRVSFSTQELLQIPGVLEFIPPSSDAVPVVFDSPHSGSHYPQDFGHCMTELGLRRLEDAYVDELFEHAPEHGVAFLRALFPRSYIDPNRAFDDVDVTMLDETWPHKANATAKSGYGIGLIFKKAAEGPVYNRPLSVVEVRERLDRYYWPYHQTLQRSLDHTWQQFGQVLHINCHSMASVSSGAMPEGKGHKRADFVLGDRDGSACAPAITAHVREHLTDAGFNVAVNAPYKGMELVQRYSDPNSGRHSLQIEINRALYLNERQVSKHHGFIELQGVLRSLTTTIGEFCRGSGLTR
jgi:N-formylglutamate deformylase